MLYWERGHVNEVAPSTLDRTAVVCKIIAKNG